MSFYQGKLDGLCGQYAVANAFELCGLLTRIIFGLLVVGLPIAGGPMLFGTGRHSTT